MAKVLIIGAGGVSQVVVHKCAQASEVFSEIHLASRTFSKCQKIASQLKRAISVHQVDADNVPQLVALINKIKPDLVMNIALPYQDLHIMDACLETGVNYLDTANYEPLDDAHFCYKWQWDYKKRFEDRGIMALLGSGFDPGVTNVFTAWAAKKHFDRIDELDIIDANAGDHGQPFATNFNPEINIREVSAKGRYFQRAKAGAEGEWIETDSLSVKKSYKFPEIGAKNIYLMYHEELESLVKNYPTIKKARFWMTFSDNYLNHLFALRDVGMTRIDPVEYQGQKIVPLQFLKAVLPDPASLGPLTKGKTCIGNVIKGKLKSTGKVGKYYIYNICNHEDCYKEVQSQAISYTTGVPAMIGGMMLLTKTWQGKGVFNMEDFNPEPFMEKLKVYGLPWTETFLS